MLKLEVNMLITPISSQSVSGILVLTKGKEYLVIYKGVQLCIINDLNEIYDVADAEKYFNIVAYHSLSAGRQVLHNITEH